MSVKMCPNCGRIYESEAELSQDRVPEHSHREPDSLFDVPCPGSRQVPRSLDDRRPLWNGQPAPAVEGGQQ